MAPSGSTSWTIKGEIFNQWSGSWNKAGRPCLSSVLQLDCAYNSPGDSDSGRLGQDLRCCKVLLPPLLAHGPHLRGPHLNVKGVELHSEQRGLGITHTWGLSPRSSLVVTHVPLHKLRSLSGLPLHPQPSHSYKGE